MEGFILRTVGIVLALFVGFLSMQEDAQAEPVVSSHYGEELRGAKTSSGETFNPDLFTAASPHLPFGTRLLVSYKGRSVVVVVNDRGPYVQGRGLDLSQRAATELGLVFAGVDTVDVVVLN
jgi:rare lipoprotein A